MNWQLPNLSLSSCPTHPSTLPPTKVPLRHPRPAWTHLCPEALFLAVPPTPKNGSIADSDLSHPAFAVYPCVTRQTPGSLLPDPVCPSSPLPTALDFPPGLSTVLTQETPEFSYFYRFILPTVPHHTLISCRPRQIETLASLVLETHQRIIRWYFPPPCP